MSHCLVSGGPCVLSESKVKSFTLGALGVPRTKEARVIPHFFALDIPLASSTEKPLAGTS
jgi:hypothetical protein